MNQATTILDASQPQRPARTVFSSAAFHRIQLRHFILFDVLPALGTLAAFVSLRWLPLHVTDIVLFSVFWLATGLGLTVGYHRYFSHRAFTAARPVAYLLLVLGLMAARGPMISWVAMHRRHHELSDRDGDMHSPNLHGETLSGRMRGFIHAHLTWMIRHDYPNVARYVPDLLRNRDLMRLNRSYYFWVAFGLALPALIGGLVQWRWQGALTGFLWGGVVRIFVVEQTMSAINSLCHLVGTKAFARGDQSRNNVWLGFVTWGEAHHNNHHAFSNSAAFGLRWHELDPGFWFIRSLGILGLVWDIKLPQETKIISERRPGT
ncbi:acyl-CoA desaturase [Methyloferula stellata]|uniref:acyl-CoA desaturase n=1 Tax=Methyloferula stellata TaxID=876270 RepID=UPI00037DF077|nr:fatty acid desaturase [Methyloferula stellata]